MLNLLIDPWLPVIRRHTGRCVIRPAQITEALDEDPVIAIDWPRPDFRIATLELLIGLLATALPPGDGDDWLDLWDEPPDPDRLDQAFAPLVSAFALDGDGPRFLQDREDLESSAEAIERLLIEAPGDSTTTKNTDLLVHRGRVTRLSRATAAIALYTFQSWAPAGGAGNRTGLRGGGPLVTLVVPGAERADDPGPALWQTLWANVPVGIPAPHRDGLDLVFPWLAPTLTSEGAAVVTPQSADPRQCWWGMPRRIRLDFAASATPQACDLTGAADDVAVVSWRQRPRGPNYALWGGHHPLTPHYRQKPGTELLAVHPQPGGIGYRHWLGLVLASADGLRVPAATVAVWTGRRGGTVARPARLIAAGFDMDNMKARGFVESEMPLPAAANRERQQRLDRLAQDLVTGTDQVANLLRSAVRQALFSAGATVKLDAALLNAVRERLWQQTEVRFFAALEAAARDPGPGPDDGRADWLRPLRAIALALFDEVAPLSADCGESAARRIGTARRHLAIALAGYGPAGATLFSSLGLPPAEPRTAKKTAKKKGTTG
ncbi:MAG: type I-E CRISPR-associated protein Cse1/CasA [Azospirillaceae bacterium]|nr:type I-E CRISPR-associated protein Cse1/CasA [Azospirillaceae bacterium]